MKEKFAKMSDEALIQELRDGDTSVTDYIMDKYKNMVRSKAGSMYVLGGEKDDLIQEGMIGLFKAIRDYDPGRDASFSTFADLCISRQMYTAVKASGRQKHTPLNTYVSFYAGNESEEGEGSALLNALVDAGAGNPEKLLIDKENYEQLLVSISEELSPLEGQVLDLYLTGMNYVQIAKVLGRDEKSTDNALSRSKQKVKKILSAQRGRKI